MALSVARLGTLMEPSFTGLNAFLAEDRASSGVMILEYVAHSAVADIRRLAAPAAGGLRGAYDLADGALERATADRPLDGDLAAAEGVLAGLVPGPAGP